MSDPINPSALPSPSIIRILQQGAAVPADGEKWYLMPIPKAAPGTPYWWIGGAQSPDDAVQPPDDTPRKP